MTPPCAEPLPLYRPRDPQASELWRLMDQHFETFQQVYDERFGAKYGFWRPVVERSVTAFLQCGDLHAGFARVRCPDCHQLLSLVLGPLSVVLRPLQMTTDHGQMTNDK